MAKHTLTEQELQLVSHLKLKRARVPLKTCLKLSLKNMWKKKFRYLVMFLICTLSLTFFSVTIELNGEKLRQNVYTMIENGYRYTDIYEHVQLTDRELEENEYNQFASQPLSGESYGTIKEKVSNITIHEYKEVQINYAGINLENGDYFFTGYLNTIIKFDNTNNYELIAGRLPKEDTKEILITDYLVEAFDYFNLYPDANNVYDYLNKRINLQHESNYIIVGIIKTNYENWKHFANVETIELSDKANYSYTNDMIIMNSVIINQKYFDVEKIGESSTISFSNDNNGSQYHTAKWTFSAQDLNNANKVNVYGYKEEPEVTDTGSFGFSSNNLTLVRRSNRSWDNSTFGRYPQADDEIVVPYQLIKKLFGIDWRLHNNSNDYDNYYTRQQHQNFWKQLEGKEITIEFTGYKNNPINYSKTYKIVGITDDTERVMTTTVSAFQITPTEFQNIYYTYNTEEETILVELPNDSEKAYNLFNAALDKGYVIDVWAYQSDIDNYIVDPFLDLASKAGLFIFAIFTMGIMWTIISIEIVDSRKEIGILRSIGLSGGKVSFIFVFQCASVILLSYVIGVIAAYNIVPMLNIGITDEFNKITLYMYTFTYRTPLYLAILVVAMTAISTVIPLFKILTQKIIDVINERDK